VLLSLREGGNEGEFVIPVQAGIPADRADGGASGATLGGLPLLFRWSEGLSSWHWRPAQQGAVFIEEAFSDSVSVAAACRLRPGLCCHAVGHGIFFLVAIDFIPQFAGAFEGDHFALP
jgi:hypothetical protein